MTNYARGRRFEWKRRDHYKEQGYTVVRSAGSKSKFDLVCLPHTHKGRVLAVQCKIVQTEAEAERMLKTLSAEPIEESSKHCMIVLDIYVSSTREIRSHILE